MIFEQLLALSERLGLGLYRDERAKHKEIHLDDDGNVLDVRPGETPFQVPDLPRKGNGPLRIDFYVESNMYARGIPDPKKKNPERARAAMEHAAAEYAKIAEESGHRGAKAVARYYEKLLAGAHAFPPSWDAAKYAFVHDGSCVATDPELRPWLRKLIEDSLVLEEEERSCVVTGEPTRCQISPHLGTKNLSSRGTGASLVSFNGSSQFALHGKNDRDPRRFLNAPMSAAASRGWGAALSYLAAKRALRLTSDLHVLLWTDQDDPPLSDAWRSLLAWDAEDRERGGTQLEAHPEWASSDVRAYVLVIGGNAGRLAVLDWVEMTVGEIASNLRRFSDLYTLRLGEDEDPEKPGEKTIRFSAWELASAWNSSGNKTPSARDLRNTTMAILTGRPLPCEQVVRRVPQTKEWVHRATAQARHRRHTDMHNPPPFTPEIVVEDQDPAFRFGRAAVVMEIIQYLAGTTKPGRVLRDLVKMPRRMYETVRVRATHHVEALQKTDLCKVANIRNSELSELVAGLVIPEKFSREQRAAFLAGYDYERARRRWLRRQREEGEAPEPSTPPAQDEVAEPSSGGVEIRGSDLL